MKCSKRSFAVVSLLFAVLLSLGIGTLNARDADLASRTFAAAQTAKQQCINTCRARYRDCHRSSVGVFTRTAPDTIVLVWDQDDRRGPAALMTPSEHSARPRSSS